MNPHYITYNFWNKPINHDELKLTIIIRVDAEGENQTYQAEDLGIYWADLGEKEDEYNLEDFLLSNAFYKTRLVVPEDSDFAKYFYATDGSIYESADKRADVLLEIKLYPNSTFEEEFRGKKIEDTIDFDADFQDFAFEASPETDILNKTMLYSLDDTPVPLNPLGLVEGNKYKLKELLLKCWQLVNPALTINDIILESDWRFAAQKYIITPYELNLTTGYTIDDIYLHVNRLFFDPAYGMTNVGDVLRKLAMDFGCFTGMITRSKPVFKKLFSYEAGDVVNLSNEDYYTNKYRYQLNIITYVRVTTRNPDTEEASVYHAPNEAAFTRLENSYIERESSLFAFMPYSGDPLFGWGNMFIYNETDEEFNTVVAVKDPSLVYGATTDWYQFEDTSYVPYGRLLADFWYAKRGHMRNCRIDNFKPGGLKYDMSKVFNFKGNTYQPLRIKKLYKQYKTEIDGIISQ